MSLKSFHVFFVIVSTLLALFFGGWGVATFSRTHADGYLACAVGGFATAVLLVIYGFWFLRKLKDVNA